MRRLLLLFCLLAPAATAQDSGTLEGWAREGQIFAQIDQVGGGPPQCQTLCDDEAACVAWVWSQPGLAGPHASCALLSSALTPFRAPGRVTGMPRRITDWLDTAMERPPSPAELPGLRAAENGP